MRAKVYQRPDGREYVDIPGVVGGSVTVTKLYILGDGGTYFQIGVEESGDPGLTFTDVGETRPTAGIVIEN